MTTGQRIRYFLNEWSTLIIGLAVLFAVLIFYTSDKTDWKPSAWILGVSVAFFMPFWLWRYFLVRSSIRRTATLGAQQHLGDIQGLDNISQAGSISGQQTQYIPPAKPEAPKKTGGISLMWKIRLGLIGIGIVFAILDENWKTIDKYFPKLNEVIHSGTPTSTGDMDYLGGRLQQDVEKWSEGCPEKMGFQECRSRIIANKPALDDLQLRVTAMNDAWVKEKSERSVPAQCQTEMDQLVAAYKDYVRVEGGILALLESMNSPDAVKKLQPRFSEMSDQEDAALNALHHVKLGNACDGY
jgi:hypothetical protein